MVHVLMALEDGIVLSKSMGTFLLQVRPKVLAGQFDLNDVD